MVLAGCSQVLSPGGNSTYQEDLTGLIPEVAESDYVARSSSTESDEKSPSDSLLVEPTMDITFRLDSLLDTIAVNDQRKRYVQGYTIQVYTGSSRSEANEAQSLVYRLLPGSKPTMSYDLPNYKVKVGRFLHRIQAQKDFVHIRKRFPNAILVPQQFVIGS